MWEQCNSLWLLVVLRCPTISSQLRAHPSQVPLRASAPIPAAAPASEQNKGVPSTVFPTASGQVGSRTPNNTWVRPSSSCFPLRHQAFAKPWIDVLRAARVKLKAKHRSGHARAGTRESVTFFISWKVRSLAPKWLQGMARCNMYCGMYSVPAELIV